MALDAPNNTLSNMGNTIDVHESQSRNHMLDCADAEAAVDTNPFSEKNVAAYKRWEYAAKHEAAKMHWEHTLNGVVYKGYRNEILSSTPIKKDAVTNKVNGGAVKGFSNMVLPSRPKDKAAFINKANSGAVQGFSHRTIPTHPKHKEGYIVSGRPQDNCALARKRRIKQQKKQQHQDALRSRLELAMRRKNL